MRNDERPTTIWIGADRLPVGDDDHDQQPCDGQAHRGQEAQCPRAGEGEHEHGLLGCVGDRRQRIRGENRQSQPLGQELAFLVLGSDRLADNPALERCPSRHQVSNSADELKKMCGNHDCLIARRPTSTPIEGAVNWLRSNGVLVSAISPCYPSVSTGSQTLTRS